MDNFVLMAVVATTGTWLLTALGAATVVFFKSPSKTIMNLMMGFAAGVMIAASFWSLLAPAVERAEKSSNLPAYVVTTIGFILGAVFIWISDKIVSYFIKISNNEVNFQNKNLLDKVNEKSNLNIKKPVKTMRFQRIIMLVLSITLHNIPEGLAVGVAFGALKNGCNAESIMGAISVAVGIGIQNFPEGAAVSLPLRREGYSRRRSFFFGQVSGFVEPIAGFLGAILVVYIEAILPYALSFAAGAMILVAVHELIPECQKNKDVSTYTATMGIVVGFALMTFLDVMLG